MAVAEEVLTYVPRGGCRELFEATDPEILIEGAAFTGKTYACCQLLHHLALKYPGCRILMVRKTHTALTSTMMVTYQQRVLDPREGVYTYGGSAFEPPEFKYPPVEVNGKRKQTIVVGAGMDNPEKILSSFYDFIFVNEAIELTEEDWEVLTTRIRDTDPDLYIPEKRLIGDCNPSHARHWLNLRCDAGVTRRIHTSLEDNPTLFNEDGTKTEEGERYIGGLDRLTGSRYERLRMGRWVGMENAAYPHFDRDVHVRDLEPGVEWKGGAIGVDYGRVHKSAAVAVRLDQFGRAWVTEAWASPSDDHGRELKSKVGQLRAFHQLYRGRTDPNQDVLAGDLGFNRARSGEGSRQTRIEAVSRVLHTFPGGRVPSGYRETIHSVPQGPWQEPDSPGLLLLKGAPGIDELCDQMEAYHYVQRVTEAADTFVIARINDDLVAALEYAIEELEHGYVNPYTPLPRQEIKSWGKMKRVS